MSDHTLMGKKLKIYAALKVLKYCTNSPAKSYQIKFALAMALGNRTDDDIGQLGRAIKEVIHYLTIRGKFSKVQPDLAAEGVVGVEVGEEGLLFLRHHKSSESFQRISFLRFTNADTIRNTHYNLKLFSQGLQNRDPQKRAEKEVRRLKDAGDAAMKRKEYDSAIKWFEAALNWQPDRGDLWECLAGVMLASGASKEVSSWLLKHHINIIAFPSELLVHGEGIGSWEKNWKPRTR